MSRAAYPLRGRTCVITGATSGIGRATALALSAAGANLILVGRRESVGIQLASRLDRRAGAGWARFFQADISDQQQVCGLAAAITATTEQVDILINNAGAKFSSFQESSNGIELTFATNYLGHFLLTCHLLEALLKAGRARVIHLGSGTHERVGVDDGWYFQRKNYDRKLAYAKSKLAAIVFSCELARRLPPGKVASNAVDPGGVATSLGRNNGLISWCRHLAYYAMKGKLLTPRRGAQTVIYLAMEQSLEGVSGKYFYEERQIDSSPIARGLEVAARLWSLSISLTGLDARLGSTWQWLAPDQRGSTGFEPAAAQALSRSSN